MKPLKQKVSITLDSDMLETLKRLADEDDRSLSQYINLVLKRHLAELETQNR
ncbi:MAG: ribbon-helix-helix protein, CopG family [Lachnospiraceae bacterium]|nr:ribbon-helix-helix protein, CopG family [Lachnospiraceae bacterium]